MKKPNFKKIVIAGGGTGGHFFPGYAIACFFKKQHPEIEVIFVGSARGIEQKVLAKSDFKLFILPNLALYRVGLLKKLIRLVLLPCAILKSFYWLICWRPDFVLGVGGYVSGPFLLACLFSGRKFFIQEQNIYPGMTNRFLGRFAALSFLVYPDKQKFFKHSFVVGNPIRPEINSLWKNNRIRQNNYFQITILGGSQGASFINKLILDSLPLLKNIKSKIKIIHQSGKLDYQLLKKKYQQSKINYELAVFFTEMVELYKNTHLFICRSGSGVFELTAAGRIGILIPITNSSGDHQRQNALQLQKNAGCFILEEKDASAKELVKIINNLFLNRKKLLELESKATNYYQGSAAEKIYNTICNYF